MKGKAGCFSKEVVAILATKMSEYLLESSDVGGVGGGGAMCVCKTGVEVGDYVSVQVASETAGWSRERAWNWSLASDVVCTTD